MRSVHCRRCFQLTPLLASSCTQCGYADRMRVFKGIGELLIYLASGAMAIGMVVYVASSFL